MKKLGLAAILAGILAFASVSSASAVSYPNWKVRVTFVHNSVTWTVGTITPKGSIDPDPAVEGRLANTGKIQPWP